MGLGTTCRGLAAAALRLGLTYPRLYLLLQLVPRWHVTNGDMLLLPCFVRLVALIESKAADIPQTGVSAESWAARSSRGAHTHPQLHSTLSDK